jgi:arylsulfatase A-like enzyme
MRTVPWLAMFLIALGFAGPASAGAAPKARPNVLFISIDDLRPQLNSFGQSQMHTPHIDALANSGRPFFRHYVQAPTCGASRYALLTSTRPSHHRRALDNSAFSLMPHDRDTEPERPVSMPDAFQRAGYHTVSLGKISHQPDGFNRRKTTNLQHAQQGDDIPHEVPFSWDKCDGPTGQWDYSWRAFFAYAGGKARQRGQTPTVEAADVSDTGYPDGILANMAVDELEQLKKRSKPFFLAVGFYKPHLPFCAPRKYWDLYERSAIELPPFRRAPQGLDRPGVAVTRSGEMFGGYKGIKRDKGPHTVSDADARLLRHAYYASVSYTDAQVGKLLDALRRLNLANDTIVVLWGDHGWHLGDHGVWGKHTLLERSLRSPMIVRVPGMKKPGEPTDALAETVDLYPTLGALCDVSVPDDLAGESLAASVRNPAQPGKSGALGYWRTGRSIRTDRWRLTRYTRGEPQLVLFDHQNDPHETTNVADQHPEVVDRLVEQLERNAPVMQ